LEILLTAENDLYAAQLQAIDTRFRAFASIVELYKALGGGWTLDVGPDPALTSSPERGKETATAATEG
jgi:outer membrane protein TolC